MELQKKDSEFGVMCAGRGAADIPGFGRDLVRHGSLLLTSTTSRIAISTLNNSFMTILII